MKNMFQITNSTYRFRKKKLVSKTTDASYILTQNRAESIKYHFQSYRGSQNFSVNLSTPKNVRLLPKLEKTFQYPLFAQRYVQTPNTDPNISRFQQRQKQKNQDQLQSRNQYRSQIGRIKQRLSDMRIEIGRQDQSLGLKQTGPKFHFVNRQGRRPYNEDRLICKMGIHKFYFKNHLKKQAQHEEQIDFYSVFDGHGGAGCAQFLKDNFVNFLIRTKNLDVSPEEALRQTFTLLEEKFIELCESKKFSTETSGACAVSCIVTESKIIAGNVGDCRAIMFNKEFLCELTKDHKPTENNEKMRILKCGGKVYKEQIRLNYTPGQPVKFFTNTRIAPGNLNVSRTIGDIETKFKKYGGLPGMISPQPQIKTFQKQNYQILVLASDGLFQAFTNTQIQKLYYKVAQAQKTNNLTSSQLSKKFLDRLIVQAQEKSTDNITIIVVNLITHPKVT